MFPGLKRKTGFFSSRFGIESSVNIYNECTRVEYNDTCKGAGEEGISEAEEVSRFATARN